MDFADWVVKELRSRDWSQADLSRSSGLTRGGISNLINRVRQPNPDTCRAIARALDLPYEVVLQKAGILPKESDKNDPRLKIIEYLVSQLDQDDQDEVIAFIETKKRIGEQRGKYNVKRPGSTQP